MTHFFNNNNKQNKKTILFKNNQQTYKSVPSLIQRYLKSGMRAVGYDILNSMSRLEAQEKARQQKVTKYDEFEYEVQPRNTTIKLKKRMEYLVDIHKQDIQTWIDKFRFMANECNWDDSTSVSVLQSIINAQIIQTMGPLNTTEVILDKLLALKYPMERKSFVYMDLQNLSQENYLLIEQYHKEITEKVKLLSYHSKMNAKEQQLKIEELFFQKLTPETRIELVKNKIGSTNEALKYLTEIENMLISIESTKDKGEDKYDSGSLSSMKFTQSTQDK